MKYLFRYLFTTIIFINSTFVQGQNIVNQDKKNKIGLAIGYNQGYFKDMIFSPLNYGENGIVLSSQYVRNNSKSMVSLCLNYSFTTLKTKYSQYFNAPYHTSNLKFTYSKKIKIKLDDFNFYMGAQFGFNFNYLDFNIEDEIDAVSFLFAHSLIFYNLIKYDLGSKHTLISSLSIPTVTLIVRPPYNAFNSKLQENSEQPTLKGTLSFFTDGYVASFNKYIAFICSTRYQYNISTHFDFNIDYILEYQRIISTFVHLQNQFKIGISYKF